MWYANCVESIPGRHGCLTVEKVEISIRPPRRHFYVGAYRDKWFLDLKWQGGRQDSVFRERRTPIATAKVCGTVMNDHGR